MRKDRIADDEHSPLIDVGDPKAEYKHEPGSNGKREGGKHWSPCEHGLGIQVGRAGRIGRRGSRHDSAE